MLYNHSLWPIITLTRVVCIKDTEWPTGTPLAVAHRSRQKIVLPPARSGYSEQLCSSLIMWWGKKDFWLTLVRNLLAHAVQKHWVQRTIGRPPVLQPMLADCAGGRKNSPAPTTQTQWHKCSARGVMHKVIAKCHKYDV